MSTACCDQVDIASAAGLRNTELHTYSGVGHHTSPEELQDLRRFLMRLLPEKLPTRRGTVSWLLHEKTCVLLILSLLFNICACLF
jgi:hypothetical protein